jgi:hypothetical protein
VKFIFLMISHSYKDPVFGFDERRPQPQHHHQPNAVACVAAVVCIVALCLPTDQDNKEAAAATAQTSSSLLKDYPWLSLTLNQKLVFAYVLGLVTMAILRTA